MEAPTSSDWMPFGPSAQDRQHPDPSILLQDLHKKARSLLALQQKKPWAEALLLRHSSTTAQHNLKELAEGRAVAVITGQQPCLWGGPSLVLHKVATAVSIARWLKTHGVPAVPMFWNASEDHDLQEMFQVEGLYPDGQLQSLRKAILDPVCAEALPALPSQDLPEMCSPWLRDLWSQNQLSWAEQISHVLTSLFSDAGLIALEPRDLAPYSTSFWQRVEAQQVELLQAYDRDEEKILLAGHQLQAPRRFPLPIFGIDQQGGRQALGNAKFKLEQFTSNQQRPSPGALLRPLFAQAQVPILVSVLGPAEMQYHRQIAGAFACMELPQPVLWPRCEGTYVPEQIYSELAKAGLDVEHVIRSKGKLSEILHEGTASLESQALSQHLQALYVETQQHFPKVTGALDRFEKDLFKAFGRLERGLQRYEWEKQGLSPQKIHRIQEWLLPKGVRQERKLGWSFILKDPEHFAQICAQFADPFDFSHRIYG